MDRVVVADLLPINVASAGLLDAPVRISWTRSHDHAYNFFEDYAIGDDGRVDVRTFNGNFYRPLTNAGTPLDVASATERVLIDYQPHSDKPQELAAAQVVATQFPGRYPRPTFAGETLSNEQDIVQALTERVEGLLVLDGTVWERCPEPVLVIEEDFFRNPSIFISPGFLDKYSPGRDKYFTFAMDELDQALAFANGRTQTQGEEVEIRVSAEIHVAVPEVLSRYQLADDAVRHASEMQRSGGAVELNRASPDYIRAWMEFSDSVATAHLTQDDAEIQLLIDAWVAFAEEKHESDGAPDYDYGLGIAQSMQARFADRTMEPGAIFNAQPKR
ncbi:hypothetical protein HFO56_01490 [Rhizobium laguerreae]|uniref:hypothetical protein n=1 Tax=Rhizobium laguerreae TaxID=1076926 RepID=UPI001C9035F6|nr:hypothetical protein [Rhizobium laguerreae]MBY3151083.1 hypothetical protein [Rhizobium laguerreae]